MAADEQDNTRQDGPVESRSDGELLGGDGASPYSSMTLASLDGLSAHDVFVGDEDFYKLLEDSTNASSTPPAAAPNVAPETFTERGRFSLVQKLLAVSIVVVSIVFAYALVSNSLGPTGEPEPPAVGNVVSQSEQPLTPPDVAVESVSQQSQMLGEQVKQPDTVLAATQPVSLEVARSFFQVQDYEKARGAYDQLLKALPAREEMLRDFMKLRMAVCSTEVGDLPDAGRLLMEISRSPSPIVRIISNYRLSLLELERKRYLRARTRAYNALALIKAVDFDDDWALAFECDCNFLVAECLTRYILSLSNVESDLPGDLWAGQTASVDPLAGLDEAELRSVLNSGADDLGKALLGPRINRLISPPRWAVTSHGAPVEELLAKFAASAEIDVEWACGEASGKDTEYGAARQRPVSLYLPAATIQQVVLTAAGCAGLLGCLQNDLGSERVVVHDPGEYSSLRRHISFLSEQAISLWRQFALTFYSDGRLGNAHFAMGLLQSQAGRAPEAIAEYKLVANRFSQSQLAPFALFHSSKVKADLRDYQGAREDLRQLVEQYDDCDVYGQAYLRLADATRDASLMSEAALLYQRVYNFGLSRESQLASALGAAQCYYQTRSYEEAAKWITRYIGLAAEDKNINLFSAHFLLGQTNLAMGDYQQACDAFQYALVEQSSRQQYIDALTALVKSHIEQGNLVEALDALENVRSVALSQEQSVEILLLRSRIYRLLGLADTAIVSLRDRAEYVSDPQLAAKIGFELAQCDIAKGNLEDARRRLSEVLGAVEPGLLAQQIALELADVCLKLGRSPQAVSICRQLLRSNIQPEMRPQVLRLMAEGYKLEKDYDKAALALSGQWK